MSVSESIARAAGLVARDLAKRVDALGCRLLGTPAQEQKVLTWRRVQPFNGTLPDVDATCFVAPNANVIGNASIGPRSGIFYQTIVRADQRSVSVGQNTTVQDRCVIRCTANYDTYIGAHVTIEPGVTISGASIADDVFIGAGSVIMEGARVESQSVVAPGSTVQKYTVIPSGEIWAGCPAEKVRDLKDEEVESLRASAIHGVGMSGGHKDATEKPYSQVEEETQVLDQWELLEAQRIPIRAPYGQYDPGPIGSGFHLNVPGQLRSSSAQRVGGV
eukprot:Hpha_TRINITY_DN16665_c0_g5::TRINITY_DN16665_c0_g5_i1::g.182184::m.182184